VDRKGLLLETRLFHDSLFLHVDPDRCNRSVLHVLAEPVPLLAGADVVQVFPIAGIPLQWIFQRVPAFLRDCALSKFLSRLDGRVAEDPEQGIDVTPRILDDGKLTNRQRIKVQTIACILPHHQAGGTVGTVCHVDIMDLGVKVRPRQYLDCDVGAVGIPCLGSIIPTQVSRGTVGKPLGFAWRHPRHAA
jgi:hypothetical protein